MKMDKNELANFKKEYTPKVDACLTQELDDCTNNDLLKQAMAYSVMAGGKRLRPLLTLAVAAAYDVEITPTILAASSAVELLHTYSLIHDDLPAMDNSDYRRGKLSNHKKFGADIATLAGDGLLTLAFEWLASIDLPAEKAIKLVKMMAKAAGPNGMVAGQVIDVASENQALDVDGLIKLDHGKTGELFHYCVMAGALLADVDKADRKYLSDFAWNFGLAFQIYDDILDDVNAGNDNEDQDKNTYVNLLGKTSAQEKLKAAITAGENNLAELHECKNKDLLNSFFSYFKI